MIGVVEKLRIDGEIKRRAVVGSLSCVLSLTGVGGWAQRKFEIVGADPAYKGLHTSSTASDSDPSWSIYKFTWDSFGSLTLKQGPLTGAWSNRAALAWS